MGHGPDDGKLLPSHVPVPVLPGYRGVFSGAAGEAFLCRHRTDPGYDADPSGHAAQRCEELNVRPSHQGVGTVFGDHVPSSSVRSGIGTVPSSQGGGGGEPLLPADGRTLPPYRQSEHGQLGTVFPADGDEIPERSGCDGGVRQDLRYHAHPGSPDPGAHQEEFRTGGLFRHP